MMHARGGIPFPLNNLPCQCGRNWALSQGCVRSLSGRRESLATAPRNHITSMFVMENVVSSHGDSLTCSISDGMFIDVLACKQLFSLLIS